jgi:hypothetical protein
MNVGKYYVLMYESGKIRLVETKNRGWEDKGE